MHRAHCLVFTLRPRLTKAENSQCAIFGRSLPHTHPGRLGIFPLQQSSQEAGILPRQESHRTQGPLLPSPSAGGDSVLKGDGRTRFDTSHQSQYTGRWGPPAQHCDKDVVSVVLGDPRYPQPESEQKRAYVPQQPESRRYDPERAAAQVFQTNIRPGDGRQRFPNSMTDAFRWKDPGLPFVSPWRKNVSSILQGGWDREDVSMTNYQFYYGDESKVRGLAAQAPCKPKVAKVCLGDDGRLTSYSTTQHSDYRPPPESHKAASKNMKLMESSIDFSRPASDAPTTSTQDMLLYHQQPKHQLTEEDLEKIKYSHVVHPWRGCRWFSTETKEKYTDKYQGPITLAVGDFQLSNVPLGTLKKYQHRPKLAP